ncbi:MAG: hypothetical protein L0196_11120 [candidate division Zixibacteria bacterium]|nr:hypothetical protein [candidate division Zixibacteria bacterium]
MTKAGLLSVLLALFSLGCAQVGGVETVEVEKKSSPRGRVANLGIPPGHLPPPGECRIWYPGRPPGHQPPPGRCGKLARELPAGAWLVERFEDEHVRVSVCHKSRPRAVVAVRIYAAATGRFVREEEP